MYHDVDFIFPLKGSVHPENDQRKKIATNEVSTCTKDTCLQKKKRSLEKFKIYDF